MKTDVAVVGAGPAGSASALLLAQRGYAVVLFDRQEFPRDKVCGEFVNPGAARLLADVFGIRPDREFERIDALRVNAARGEPLVARLQGSEGESAPAYSVPRTHLDLCLVEAARAAGVQVVTGANVTDLAMPGRIAGTMAGQEPFACGAKLVIAADGTNSRLARICGLTRSYSRLQRLGVSVHFADVPAVGDRFLDMFVARRGALGVAGFSRQANGGAVLAAGIPLSRKRAFAADKAQFVRDLMAGLEIEEIGRIRSITAVPCFGHVLRRTFADRILFVGDAAEFVDPFTGEGIHHALVGAQLAAEAGAAFLCRNRELSEYADARDTELDGRYLLCRFVQAFVHRPSLVEPVLSILRRSPHLTRDLVLTLADLLTPEALVRRCLGRPA